MISKPINYNSNLYVEHVDGIAIKQGVNVGKKVVHVNNFIDDENEHIAFVVNDWEFQDAEIEQAFEFDKTRWEQDVVEPAVIQHINAAIRPKPYDYIDYKEVLLWLNDSVYSAEANAIAAWIRTCFISVSQQVEEATEPINIEQIILNLPPLYV